MWIRGGYFVDPMRILGGSSADPRASWRIDWGSHRRILGGSWSVLGGSTVYHRRSIGGLSGNTLRTLGEYLEDPMRILEGSEVDPCRTLDGSSDNTPRTIGYYSGDPMSTV